METVVLDRYQHVSGSRRSTAPLRESRPLRPGALFRPDGWWGLAAGWGLAVVRPACAWRVLGVAATATIALAGAIGCGSRRPPPVAGAATQAVPDLTGRTVMVFPVQGLEGVSGDVDAELAFSLRTRMGAVDWVMPGELREAVQTSPSLDVRLDGLPVGMFLRTEVERVGDPLYGIVRRLAALTGGEVALIPVLVRYRPEDGGDAGGAEVTAALLDVRSGYVLWFGVERGEDGPATEAAVVASAVDALARRLTVR